MRALPFLHKGSRVRVICSLHTQLWENRESRHKRFKMVVRADDDLFLNTRERTQDESEAVEDLAFSSDWRSLISHGRRFNPQGSARPGITLGRSAP